MPSIASAESTAVPVVSVIPPVVELHQTAKVVVRRLGDVATVEARLEGASTPSGTLLPWTHLRLAHGVWVGRLGQPALRGVYPIELRARPGARHFVSKAWLLRVFPPGTVSRPGFETPEAVVTWWVANVAHGTIAFVRPWPLLPFDHRDPQLHRLFVVAYDPANATDATSRLGIWITAVRGGYAGRWRFLEATVQP